MSGIDLTVEPVGVGIAAGVDGDTLFSPEWVSWFVLAICCR
nr:hypothetical protein [Escherichia coli]